MSATGVMETAPMAVEPAPAPRHTAAVLALARFEARELLQYIPVFVFFLLYVGYTVWQMFSGREGMDAYPVLQDVDRGTQAKPFFVAIALLVCVNRAALRSRRNGTDRHDAVLPMEPWRRTLAHALSVVPYAALTALVVTFEFTWAALKPGATGHGSFAELAVAPLTVLLSGTVGVLLARLVPSSFAAPLVVVGGYILFTLVSVNVGGAHWLRELWPVVTETGAAPYPSALIGRPAAWHALYLAGLALLLLCGGLLLSGGRTRLIRVTAVAALAVTVAGAAGQAPGDSAALKAARAEASVHPERVQKCVAHGTSTYCAFPEWTGLTADWAATADRVQSLAGGAAGSTRLTVRQRVEARYGLEGSGAIDPLTAPGQVTVGTAWGGNRIPQFEVAVASVLVAGDEATGGEVCDSRVVTIMWLALGAESDPVTALRDVRLDDSVTGSAIALAPAGAVSMSAGQTEVVRQLLQQPRYGVTAKVKAHWTELTSPKTSLTRVAELLDVKAPTKGETDGETSDESCGA
ncbi:ABC transporter permease [Streptomyces sp. NPDC059582]|uniref:ABC transporter permease n=1 Tax=Streptomyces sp. NPDC059582 TaxID=3346875 RepID=UPI0036D02488